jgi:hypothetical protein
LFFFRCGLCAGRIKSDKGNTEPEYKKLFFTPEMLDELQTEAALFQTLKGGGSKRKLANWKNSIIAPSLWPNLALSMKEFGIPEHTVAEDYIIVLEGNQPGSSAGFLLKLAEAEVNEISVEHRRVLFREDTLFTTCFRVYSRLYGMPWIWKTLSGPVKRFLTDVESAELEIDADKLGEAQLSDLYANTLKLKLFASEVWSAFVQNLGTFPSQIIQLIFELTELSDSSEAKDAKENTLAIFIFTRFLCVAIVSPQSFGICGPPSRQVQRNLVLVSKVLQNLATRTKFGEKEEFMTVLNDFISEKKGQVKRVYSDILSGSSKGSEAHAIPIPESIMVASLKRLYYNALRDPNAFKESLLRKMEITFTDDFSTTMDGKSSFRSSKLSVNSAGTPKQRRKKGKKESSSSVTPPTSSSTPQGSSSISAPASESE